MKKMITCLSLFFVLTGFSGLLGAAEKKDKSLNDKLVDVNAKVTSAPVGNALSKLQEYYSSSADKWQELSKESKTIADKLGGKGRKSYGVDKYQKAMGDRSKNKADNLGKLGKALEYADILSVMSATAGYAWEGDLDGASAVLLSDLCKRASVAIGTGLGTMTGVPGGTIAGGYAAEEFHSKYVDSRVHSTGDKARDKKYREKYLMSAPRVTVMDKTGKQRVLPEDMYMGKDGLVHRRTPDEQKAFIEQWHRDRGEAMRIKAAARQAKMDGLDAAFKNKEINFNQWKQQSDSIIDQFSREAKIAENEQDKVLKKENWIEAEKKRIENQQKKMLDNLDRGQNDFIEAKNLPNILDIVPPVKMFAEGSRIYTQLDMKNKYQLFFWNVGSLSPQYAKATIVVISTATSSRSVVGEGQEMFRVGGTFSGGPNGSFKFEKDKDSTTGRIVNGTTIVMDDGTVLTVKTPKGFGEWPRRR